MKPVFDSEQLHLTNARKGINKMTLPKISQEPIIHVDATPNEGYPLRILRAYRENCNCEWVSDTDNPLIDKMNKDCRQRAVILDAAIAILGDGKRGNSGR